MLVSKVYNIYNTYNHQVNNQKNIQKMSFGNDVDKNRKFLSIISSFPNVKDHNSSKQDEAEYARCYKIIKDYLNINGSQNINLGDGLINLAGLGHYKIVEYLLDRYKVDANYRDMIGSTPIMYAAMKGHAKTVEVLGRYGAEVNVKNNMGYNALMLAAMGNHSEAMDKIISINPVYINDTDDAGRTALMHAVILENNAAVDKLLDYNANLDVRNKAGKTALMYAAGNLDRKLMKKLESAGADTKIVDNFGSTANDTYKFVLEMLYMKIELEGRKNFPPELLARYYEIKNAKSMLVT